MIRFRMASMLGLALAIALPCAAQKQLAGEWEGTMSTGDGEVQILWHVTEAGDGTLTSTFDNTSEGLSGIKMKSLELKDNTLTVTVDDQVEINGSPATIRGAYTGTVSADGNEITGTWVQEEPQPAPALELKFRRVSAGPAAKQ